MTAVSSVYAQRLLMTLFLVSFGIYMFLATVTYTPFDPGWMHISSDTQVGQVYLFQSSYLLKRFKSGGRIVF